MLGTKESVSLLSQLKKIWCGIKNFTITIQGDSEGYVTFECPYCDSEFKLQAGEYQNDDEPFEELFCPYCGLVKEKNATAIINKTEPRKTIFFFLFIMITLPFWFYILPCFFYLVNPFYSYDTSKLYHSSTTKIAFYLFHISINRYYLYFF